jgi:hypothetical protein
VSFLSDYLKNSHNVDLFLEKEFAKAIAHLGNTSWDKSDH